MTNISIPLPEDLLSFIDEMIKSRKADSKASVVRNALYKLAEEEAIKDILEARIEVKEGKILKGDLDELASKLK